MKTWWRTAVATLVVLMVPECTTQDEFAPHAPITSLDSVCILQQVSSPLGSMVIPEEAQSARIVRSINEFRRTAARERNIPHMRKVQWKKHLSDESGAHEAAVICGSPLINSSHFLPTNNHTTDTHKQTIIKMLESNQSKEATQARAALELLTQPNLENIGCSLKSPGTLACLTETLQEVADLMQAAPRKRLYGMPCSACPAAYRCEPGPGVLCVRHSFHPLDNFIAQEDALPVDLPVPVKPSFAPDVEAQRLMQSSDDDVSTTTKITTTEVMNVTNATTNATTTEEPKKEQAGGSGMFIVAGVVVVIGLILVVAGISGMFKKKPPKPPPGGPAPPAEATEGAEEGEGGGEEGGEEPKEEEAAGDGPPA